MTVRPGPDEPSGARVDAELAAARRRIIELEAQLAQASQHTSTLELTVQSTIDPGRHRVKAEWNRPGDPVACERTFTLDEEALRTSPSATAYGTTLGEAVFADNVRDLFTLARGDGTSLRVLLAVEAEELQALRWERLCGPFEDGAWLPLRPNQRTPFSLYIPSTSDRKFPPFRQDELRALVVVASPERGNTRVSWFDEALALETVLAGLGDIPSVVLANVEGAAGRPSLEEICRQLSVGRFTLLHIVCHGAVARGDTVVFLDADAALPLEVEREGKTAFVPASRLIERLGEIGRERGLPHFAFLAVCDSAAAPASEALATAATRDREALRGLGQRMVRDLGMKAVLAMTDKISQTTALALGRAFYPALQRHGEPDVALAEACIAVRERPDVATPALFCRVVGKRLFTADAARQELAPDELDAGLARLEQLLAERAPVLLQATLPALRERLQDPATARDALTELERLCEEALELGFVDVARGARAPKYDAVCPFPGLRAFTAAQQRYFRGRAALVATLVERLKTQSFVCVLGASGSGKSSLVAAGVIPALTRSNRALRVARMTPGADPPANLAAARAELGDAAETLLSIDQFEETFTLCTSAATREKFLDEIAGMARPERRIIMTMRADFMGECAAHAGLRRAVQRQPELVPPMTPDELRGAIEEQAREAGLRFETGLSERILPELVREPGAMPLLQHALAELWERRHGRWLRRAAWEAEIGGVAGAIERTAESVWQRLDAEDQRLLPDIMTKLTRVGGADEAGGVVRDTRQRAAIRELAPRGATDEERARVRLLVSSLAGEGARLLVTSVDERTGEQVAEVAHEALLRHWPRLRGWINAARDLLLMKQDLRVSAQGWVDADKLAEFLEHRGARAQAVRAMVDERGLTLDERELHATKGVAPGAAPTVGSVREYFAACVAEDERQERTRAEAEQKLRDALRRARDQARISAAREATGDPTTQVALLRDVEQPAATRGWMELAHAALHESIAAVVLHGHEDAVVTVALAPDGEHALTASGDGTARVWRTDGASAPVVLRGHEGPLLSATFSSDGSRALTASWDGTARVWPTDGGEPVVLQHDDCVLAAAFSADGERVVTAATDRTARVWRSATGEELRRFMHDAEVTVAAFAPDGARVVAGCKDGTARVWSVDGAGEPAVLRHEPGEDPEVSSYHREITAAAFSFDGAHVLTATRGLEVRVWRADGAGEPVIFAHEQAVAAAAFSPVGPQLLAAAGDAVVVWRIDDASEPAAVWRPSDGRINFAAFAADGAHVLATSDEGVTRVWKIGGEAEPAVLREPQPVHAALSVDRTLAVTGSQNGTARVWRVAQPTRMVVKVVLGVRAAALRDGELDVVTASDEHDVSLGRGDADPVVLGRHGGWVDGVRFSRDGSLLLTRTLASADLAPRVWRCAGGEGVALAGHEDSVFAAEFSRDGRRVVTASADGTVRVWSTATGVEEARLAVTASNAALSPDGATIVTTGGSVARVWSVGAPCELVREYDRHAEDIRCVAVSPDGAWVATAAGKVAHVWRQGGAGEVVVLAHRSAVLLATFSPDSACLLTALDDQTARLWRIADGRELLVLRGHQHWITAAEFAPDGRRLVTVSGYEGVVRVWPIDVALVLDMMWQATSLCLPPAERERRLGETAEEAEAGARATAERLRALDPSDASDASDAEIGARTVGAVQGAPGSP